MSSSKNNTSAPVDAAAKVVEEKVTTVPAQANPEIATETGTGEDVEAAKKSLKDRLASVAAKLKANKKTVFIVSATVGVTALAFVKYTQQKAEQDPFTEDEQKQILDDLAADGIAG